MTTHRTSETAPPVASLSRRARGGPSHAVTAHATPASGAIGAATDQPSGAPAAAQSTSSSTGAEPARRTTRT
eukprot:1757156-Alexandrium_andersonii.AAC.1